MTLAEHILALFVIALVMTGTFLGVLLAMTFLRARFRGGK